MQIPQCPQSKDLLSIGEKSSSFRLYIFFIVVSVFFQGDERNREGLEMAVEENTEKMIGIEFTYIRSSFSFSDR